MPCQTLKFTIEDEPHEIEVSHHLITPTELKVKVDGEIVGYPHIGLMGGEVPLEIGEAKVKLLALSGTWDWKYDVTQDGKSLISGEETKGKLAASNEKARFWFSLYMIVAGAFLGWFLQDRLIAGLPAPIVGGGLAVVGVFGLLGANIFRSGPLDKRLDEQ